MKSYDLYEMSVRNLWRRKLRAALTILGVVIGTASIIMMFSLSEAMNVNYENQMNQWGELSLIEVTQEDSMDDLVEVEILNDTALSMIESMTNVEQVIPMLETQVTLNVGDYGTMREMTIVGYEADELEALGYIAEEGRNYSEGEEDVMIVGGDLMDYLVKKGEDLNKQSISSSREISMPIGSSQPTMAGMRAGRGSSGGISGMREMLDISGLSAEDMMAMMEERMGGTQEEMVDLFEERAILTFETFSFKMPGQTNTTDTRTQTDQTTTIKPITVDIVGQLPAGNPETDNLLIVPRETVLYLIQQKELQDAKAQGRTPEIDPVESYEKVVVKVENSEDVEWVRTQIEMLGFQTDGAQDTLDEMKQMSSNIQVILLAIGGISLIVAAIGITNTMMTSIYERTKEIGVMKVIGASIGDIKKIFLVEAAIIGGVGGTIGIGVCYTLSYLLNTYGKDFFGSLVSTSAKYETYVSIITPTLALSAIAFSVVIGVISGYMPAQKATSLSALSAMRND